jgi:alpha-glucosidase
LGFSNGAPWLPLGPAHAALSVRVQEGDPDSTLAFAKALLARRRSSRALRLGTQKLLPSPLPLIAFVREQGDEKLLCVFNLGQETLRFDDPLLSRAEPLDWGCGWSHFSPNGLSLGPLSAWFARL